jgi:hypothetical protein
MNRPVPRWLLALLCAAGGIAWLAYKREYLEHLVSGEAGNGWLLLLFILSPGLVLLLLALGLLRKSK